MSSSTTSAKKPCGRIFPCRVCWTACSRSPGACSGVRIEAADGDVPVWHEDVRFFRICDEHGREIAAFYLDPYSRPAEKRGGAWMDECVGRSRLLAPSGAAGSPAGRLPDLQSDAAGGRPALADVVQRAAHPCSTSSGTACITCSPPSITAWRRASTTWIGMPWNCRASSWRTGATTAKRCSA